MDAQPPGECRNARARAPDGRSGRARPAGATPAPPFTRTAYVRYAGYERGRVVLRGGFPFWGPVLYDPPRRRLDAPGAARLRYTADGTYPVPIRPDWPVSRTAVTVDGDTLSLDDIPNASDAPLRVVPIVLREDGKVALGDVYQVGSSTVVSPLAAVEDLRQKE